MKNLLILVVLAAFVLLSCSKEQSVNDQINQKMVNLEKLNKYRPAKDALPNVYHSFKKEVKEMRNLDFKSTIEPIDRTVDEAVWLLEAATNADFGFKSDSIEEVYIDTIQIVFNNKSLSSEGIPIIDGNEIIATFNDIENSIVEDENVGHLFWVTRIEITSISDENTTIDMINAGGPKSNELGRVITPLPPGTNIDPFPSGYWNYAGVVSSYMVYAELDFWNKTRAPGNFYLDDGYIATYLNTVTRSAYTYDHERILWGLGHCNSYVLSTNMMNQYLYSSKEVIDESNPNNSNPNLMVGYFKFNCWETHWNPGSPPNPTPGGGSTTLDWFQHAITLDIYEIEYVGLEE